MRRSALVATALVMFALGAMLAVFVAGSASAASAKKPTTKTTSKKKTTTKSASKKKTTTSKAAPSTVPTPTYGTTTTASPGDSFFVINGTVNAASDHEIVGSSAFPNFTTGAVDNYYSMAHSHVDNSPFAEGTASPADTGPIGQTAAAGNTQQPQYADARWPGDPGSGKATYGTQGQPYAEAAAGEYQAKASASEATNGLSGPGLGGKRTLALPVGFDLRLREALAGWKEKWQNPLGLKKPALPKKPSPTVTTPVGTVTVPKAGVTVPKLGVTTPAVTVPVPTPPGAGANPAPPVTVPSTSLPSVGAQGSSRSLAARPLSPAAAPASPSESSSTPADGESLLSSSTEANLVPDTQPKTDPCATGTAKPDTAMTTTATPTTTKAKSTKTKTAKTKSAKAKAKTTKSETPTAVTPNTDTTKAAPCKPYALVTSGESSLGRVSLGGGQIVIHGIHVTASITNDGTPSYKAAVSVASATIGGVPVTIDQDGVHVAGQGQGVPYQQASDALNGALKQAGIQLFLVGPEVTTCGQTGTGTGAGGGTGAGTTTTSSSSTSSSRSTSTSTSTTSSADQSGSTSQCGGPAGGGGSCDQSGAGSGGGTGGPPGLPGSPTASTAPSGTDTTASSCAPPTCDQSASGTGTGSTTTTAATTPRIGTTPTPSRTTTTSRNTTTTSTDQSGSTTSSSSCGGSSLPSTTGSCASTGTGTGMTTTSSSQSDTTTMTTGSGDQFGLGAGTSNAGEMTVTATGVHVVFTQPVNQSGVPAQYVEHILGEVYVDSLATPASSAPGLGLSASSLSSSSSSSLSSSCGGGGRSGGASSGLAAGGSSSAGGSGSSSSPSGSGLTAGSSSSGSPLGHALAGLASMLRTKPLWVLIAFLVWQALAIGTGASLWHWRKGGAP